MEIMGNKKMEQVGRITLANRGTNETNVCEQCYARKVETKINWDDLADILAKKRSKVSISDLKSCGLSEGKAVEYIIRIANLTEHQLDALIEIIKREGERK